MDRSDKALLAAFLLAAGVGIATRCLMHEDAAVIIAAGWLGSFWDLRHVIVWSGRQIGVGPKFGVPKSASA